MSIVCAGNLNRRITIQQKALSTNTPDPVETWSTWATVWAERMDTRGRETFAAAREELERHTVYTIRYRAGLRGDMRIVEGADQYDIESIAELGFKEGWEISAVRRGDG